MDDAQLNFLRGKCSLGTIAISYMRLFDLFLKMEVILWLELWLWMTMKLFDLV